MTPRVLVLLSALLASSLLAPAPAIGGSAASEGLGRLRTQQQRNRLEDLRTDSRRRLEADRLRGTGAAKPGLAERLERRWRAEDRQTDFQRDREREAIELDVRTGERMDRAAERLPGPVPGGASERAAAAEEDRAAFDQELRDVERREALERLRRDSRPRAAPGVRLWPR